MCVWPNGINPKSLFLIFYFSSSSSSFFSLSYKRLPCSITLARDTNQKPVAAAPLPSPESSSSQHCVASPLSLITLPRPLSLLALSLFSSRRPATRCPRATVAPCRRHADLRLPAVALSLSSSVDCVLHPSSLCFFLSSPWEELSSSISLGLLSSLPWGSQFVVLISWLEFIFIEFFLVGEMGF